MQIQNTKNIQKLFAWACSHRRAERVCAVRMRGFTLIEMIVAIGIFTAVMTISLTAFLNISNIQRKAMSFRAVNDNLNFAMEMMMREIRTGDDYGSGGATFRFVNAKGCETEFSLQSGQINKEVITNNPPTCTGTLPLAVTSDEVEVTELNFIVEGEGIGDGLQPRVTIIMTGSAGIKVETRSEMEMQVTVSQRSIDS